MGISFCDRHSQKIGQTASKELAHEIKSDSAPQRVRSIVVQQEEVEFPAVIGEWEIAKYEQLLGASFNNRWRARIGDDDFDRMNLFLSTLALVCPACLSEYVERADAQMRYQRHSAGTADQ